MSQPIEIDTEVLHDVRRRRLRQVIVAVGVLLLFGLLSWSANFRVSAAQEAGAKQAVDAIAITIAPLVLKPGKDLNLLCAQLADGAGFAEVTVTDTSGKVTASNKREKLGTKMDVPGKLPSPTVRKSPYLVRGIEISPKSENYIGALFVE